MKISHLVAWQDSPEGSIVTMTSPLTGKNNSMILKGVTRAMYDSWALGGTLIQHAFPFLSADEREFLLSGYTQEDWDKMFPKEDEDDV